MRNQKRQNSQSLERRIRLSNLYFALQLDLLGKTREERFQIAAKYQAQSDTPKTRWLC